MKSTALLFLLCATTLGSYSATLYVNQNAPAGGNGQTWATAYNNLDIALQNAQVNDDVWVAAGTYVPGNGVSRTSSFVIPGGVSVYGGFIGTETSLSERAYTINVCILSGERGGPQPEDNVATVVRLNSSSLSCRIDGFVIEGGYSNLVAGDAAGVNIGVSSGFVVANCLFKNNTKVNTGLVNASSTGNGGAALSARPGSGNFTVHHCIFQNNSMQGNDGGAINFYLTATSAATITISSTGFFQNTGSRYAGAVYLNKAGTNSASDVVNLRNNVFYENQASFLGSAMLTTLLTNVSNCSFHKNSGLTGSNNIHVMQSIGSSAPLVTLTNSILYDNPGAPFSSAAFSNGFISFSANIIDNNLNPNSMNVDPLFVHSPTGDLRVRPGSPAIDAGSAAAASGLIDYLENPRVMLGGIDIGAFEMQDNDKPIIYIRKSNPYAYAGYNWTTALTELAQFDPTATEGVRVFISAETYSLRPDETASGTLQLCRDCELIGGFVGLSTGVAVPSTQSPTVITCQPDDPNLTPNPVLIEADGGGSGSIYLYNLVFRDRSADMIGGPLTRFSNLESVQLEYIRYRSNEAIAEGVLAEFVSVQEVEFEEFQFINNGLAGTEDIPAMVRLEGCNSVLFNQGGFNSNGTMVRMIDQQGGNLTLRNTNVRQAYARLNVLRLQSNEGATGTSASSLLLENVALSNSVQTSTPTGAHAAIQGVGLFNTSLSNLEMSQSGYATVMNIESRDIDIRHASIFDQDETSEFRFIFESPSWSAGLGSFTMANSILSSNGFTGGEIEVPAGQFQTIALTHLLANPGFIFPVTPLAVQFDQPFFVDPANGDLTLNSWSPAIDAGDDSFSQNLLTDIAGDPRIAGSQVDLGCYERALGCIPSNTDCASAQPLVLDVAQEAANVCAPISPGASCVSNPGQAVWFAFEAPASGQATITTSDLVLMGELPNFNLRQAIYTGDCSNLVEIACTNEAGSLIGETTELSGLTAGATYWVRVDGIQGQEARFTITLSTSGPECLGDLNLDGLVNASDLALFLSQFGDFCTACLADLNEDGIVNSSDLALMLTFFGSTCE